MVDPKDVPRIVHDAARLAREGEIIVDGTITSAERLSRFEVHLARLAREAGLSGE